MPGCRRVHSGLESSQGQEKGESIGALWASFVGNFLVVARAAGHQLDHLSRWREGAAKICLLGVCFLVVARLDAVAVLHRRASKRSFSTGMEFRRPAGIVKALFWQRTRCSMRKVGSSGQSRDAEVCRHASAGPFSTPTPLR